MRRPVLLLTLMATAVILASGVALAKAITCPNRADGTCVGTKKADTITGTGDADEIYGLKGADEILALERLGFRTAADKGVYLLMERTPRAR